MSDGMRQSVFEIDHDAVLPEDVDHVAELLVRVNPEVADTGDPGRRVVEVERIGLAPALLQVIGLRGL